MNADETLLARCIPFLVLISQQDDEDVREAAINLMQDIVEAHPPIGERKITD